MALDDWLLPMPLRIHETLSASNWSEAPVLHINVKIPHRWIRVFQPNPASVDVGTLFG